jgi:hypothetical protein
MNESRPYKFSKILEKFIREVKLTPEQIKKYANLKTNLDLATKHRAENPKNMDAVKEYNYRYDLVMQFEVETGIMALAKAFCKEQAKKHRFNIKIN